MDYCDDYEDKAEEQLAARRKFKQAFVPVETTKEYAETTYFGIQV